MSEETRQETTQPVEEKDPIVLENARIGYQTAVALWTYQSNLNWGRFNAMLTANSIITAVIGVVLTNQPNLVLLSILLPIVGLLLCTFWVFIMVRGRDYHRHWVSQACELEERYLTNAVNVVAGMASKGAQHRTIRNSRLSKTKMGSSQDVTIYGVILAFAMVYFVALIQMLQ